MQAFRVAVWPPETYRRALRAKRHFEYGLVDNVENQETGWLSHDIARRQLKSADLPINRSVLNIAGTRRFLVGTPPAPRAAPVRGSTRPQSSESFESAT
ncbi:hypothetical protein EVAR_21106_1 [Eumeta japonica]|uniref:Uncharacterized protein n=1 Tax=Eumeta variegata TaxID=151549 RepID=A0A4C1VUQ3_EUMVA|nr:hypothetical protein EVAR_21106_1 [Eumeta japonica]